MSDAIDAPAEDRALCDLEIDIRNLRYDALAMKFAAEQHFRTVSAAYSTFEQRHKEILDEITVIRRMMRLK